MRGEHLLHVLLDLFTPLSWRSDRHNMGFQHVLKKKTPTRIHKRVFFSRQAVSLYVYIQTLRSICSFSNIIPIFTFVLLRPRLEYCVRSRHKNDTDKLERIRRRTTKLIQELRDLRHDKRQHDCGRTCLEMRRLSGHQIDFLKY